MSQLGADSRYMKAQQQDRELAAQIVAKEIAAEEQGQESEPWRPAAEDWTLLHEMLAQIFDRLGALAMITAHAKPEVKGPDPFPRPVTELSKARQAANQVKLDRYDEKLLDHVNRAKERWRAMSEEERDALADRGKQS